jgi:hypothetical protein
MTTKTRFLPAVIAFASLPLLGGAQGDGCAAGSDSPAPDVQGTWDLEYDDSIGVEVKIGGAVYNTELGPNGGAFAIRSRSTARGPRCCARARRGRSRR